MMFFVTLLCRNGCHETLRIGRGSPGGSHLPYKYCPLCGAEGVLAQCDENADWWDAMCEAAQLPKLVLEPIYELWRTDTENHLRFMDYVTKFRNSGDSFYEEVMKHASK